MLIQGLCSEAAHKGVLAVTKTSTLVAEHANVEGRGTHRPGGPVLCRSWRAVQLGELCPPGDVGKTGDR